MSTLNPDILREKDVWNRNRRMEMPNDHLKGCFRPQKRLHTCAHMHVA